MCHFNTREADGTEGTVSGQVPLANKDGSKRFREHPDPDTDVYAIEVTDVMKLNTKIEKRWVGYDLFADEPKRAELDITVGEDIVTIGYPLGLRQGDTNFPLVRQGVIATKIGTHLKDKTRTHAGTLRERTLRAFLIDGATVPGSSGSPVILKPVIGRIQGNAIVMGSAPPVLLSVRRTREEGGQDACRASETLGVCRLVKRGSPHCAGDSDPLGPGLRGGDLESGSLRAHRRDA